MFYSILASNVSQETLTTCEWRSNTQPHVHSISSLVRMFRTMLIEERDGGLYLLQGTPRRWLEQDKQLCITKAPTWYGALSLRCVSDISNNTVRVHLRVPPRLGTIPLHLKLRLPQGQRLREAIIDGQPRCEVQGEWIVLHGVQGEVEIAAQTATAK